MSGKEILGIDRLSIYTGINKYWISKMFLEGLPYSIVRDRYVFDSVEIDEFLDWYSRREDRVFKGKIKR